MEAVRAGRGRAAGVVSSSAADALTRCNVTPERGRCGWVDSQGSRVAVTRPSLDPTRRLDSPVRSDQAAEPGRGRHKPVFGSSLAPLHLSIHNDTVHPRITKSIAVSILPAHRFLHNAAPFPLRGAEPSRFPERKCRDSRTAPSTKVHELASGSAELLSWRTSCSPRRRLS